MNLSLLFENIDIENYILDKLKDEIILYYL